MKKLLHLTVLLIFLLSLTLLLPSCGGPQVDAMAGDLYSIETGDGTYSIVKVLAVDDEAVHLRLYKNRFPTRPDRIDTSELSLGSIHEEDGVFVPDEDGLGIGHLPIARATFEEWQPRFLTVEPVTEEELEGYRLWQEQTAD